MNVGLKTFRKLANQKHRNPLDERNQYHVTLKDYAKIL